MNSKPQKNWGEIQLAIAAISLTVTLVFWNLFSTPQKQQVMVQATDTEVPPPPDATQVLTQAPTQAPVLAFVPVKIIFGGTVPQQPQTVVQGSVAPAVQPKHKSGGGGPRPKPPVGTGSSKP
jgi:hypothetical protein